MAKQIRKSDISESDIYGDITLSAKALNVELDKSNSAINKQAESIKKWVSANEGGQKAIDKTLIARQKMNELQDKAENSDKKKLQSEKALQKQRLDEIKIQQNREKAMDKFERTRQKEIKTAQKSRIEAAKEGNAFKILTKRVNSASDRFKRLAAQHGVNSTQARKAEKTFRKLDNELRQINKHARDGRRDVGRYGKALEGVRGSALRMAGGLGLAVGGFSLIRGAGTLLTDFESSIASLGAITGLTGKGLEELKGKVLDVSNATGKSATEISEAMKLVGSAQPELLKNADALAEVTKQAVILAQAGGIDVPAAAAALTKSMNQFGVSAEEAANFTDILATSQQKGTATIEQISESMKNAGSVAKASGLSFQTTNAALQGLAKGGIVGAEAGTKLRSILTKLAKTGRDELNPSTQKFSDILNVLQGEVTDVTSATKIFGEENAGAALTLIDQKQVVQDLDGALLDHGNAQKQAGQNMDTLAGAYEKAKTSLQNYILGSDGATSVSNGLKSSLQFLAQNIGTIITVLGKAIRSFIVFKTVMFALKMQQHYKDFKLAGGSIKNLGKNMDGAGASANKFGKALKGIGIGVAVVLFTELAAALWDIVSGASSAADRLERLQAIEREGNKERDKFSSDFGRALRSQQAERTRSLEIAKQQREEDIKNGIARAKAIKTEEEAIKKANDAYEKFLNPTSPIGQSFIDQLRAQYIAIQDQLIPLATQEIELAKKIENSAIRTQRLFEARMERNKLVDQKKSLRNEIDLRQEAFDKFKSQSSEIEIIDKNVVKTGKVKTDSQEKQISLLQEITDERIKQIKSEETQEKTRLTTDVDRLIKSKEATNATELEKAAFAKLVRENLVTQLAEIDANYRKQELDAELEHQAEMREAVLEAKTEEAAQTLLAFEESRQIEMTRLLSDQTKDREEIELDYNKFLLDQIDLRLLNMEISGENEIDLLLEQAELERQIAESLAEDKAESAERLNDYLKDLGDEGLKQAVIISQEKQKLLDDEISASQKLEDSLREKANNGNAIAEESLSKQEDITNQAIAAKKKEAQKEQALQELGLLYESIRQFVEDGDSLPLATAKGTAGVFGVRKIAEALFGLGGFSKGGYTGDGGKHEAKGIVHGGEFVIDKETTSSLGLNGANMSDFNSIISNADSVQNAVMMAQLKGSETIQSVGDKSVDYVNSILLQKEIQTLIKVVKDKKETVISEKVKDGILIGLQTQEKEGSITNVYNKLFK